MKSKASNKHSIHLWTEVRRALWCFILRFFDLNLLYLNLILVWWLMWSQGTQILLPFNLGNYPKTGYLQVLEL